MKQNYKLILLNDGRNILVSDENADNGHYNDEITWYYHFPKTNGYCVTSSWVELGYTEISYEQFKKYILNQSKIKYTQEYCKQNKILVKIDSIEEGKQVAKYVKGRHEDWEKYLNNRDWFFRFDEEGYDLWINSRNFCHFDKYKIISAQQFIKDNMNREIISYKLLKDLPDAEKGITSIKIKNKEVYFPGIELRDGCQDNVYLLSFVESKPDWFEPVYKPQETIISVGGKFDVTIKENKVFHKSDDITDFVKELVQHYEKQVLEDMV